MCGEKKEFPMIRVRLFKEKEEGGEGRSKAWWPMECSKLGSQWKVPCLVANGR